jgi:hypothetical protein
VFKEGELDEKSNVQNLHIAGSDRPVKFYKLDVIIVVKNHPFSDGNKRSGAFLFVDFLHRNGRLLNAAGEAVINDAGLAALTLLVAESDPKQMETLIRLIMNMLVQEADDGAA